MRLAILACRYLTRPQSKSPKRVLLQRKAPRQYLQTGTMVLIFRAMNAVCFFSMGCRRLQTLKSVFSYLAWGQLRCFRAVYKPGLSRRSGAALALFKIIQPLSLPGQR